MKLFFLLLSTILFTCSATAQTRKVPVITAAKAEAVITDGPHVVLNWRLDPKADPDIYYINIPRKKSKVSFRTDQGEVSFHTRFGMDYNLLVIVDHKDSCHIRISAKDDPGMVQYGTSIQHADTIPFTIVGSRVYLKGVLNGNYPATIQLDLGAGTNTVNKQVAEKSGLKFEGKTIVSNTQGEGETRSSLHNDLSIGGMQWTGLPFVEVSNMKPDEDLIIGNGLFRDKVIELDYDRKVLIVSEELPAHTRLFRKQPVFYEQNRPKFEAGFRHNNRLFTCWFLFDTGRDGTMLIGEDFTSRQDNWNKLHALQVVNGRKIIRLDAIIAGVVIKDIVTNAADPGKPAGRPTLFGNQVLNHFNMILDNRTGTLYLKPNGRTGRHIPITNITRTHSGNSRLPTGIFF